MTDGIVFAILAMIFWGFEELYLKEAISGLKSLTTFLINTAVGFVLSLLIIYFFLEASLSLINGQDIFLVLITTLVAFTGYLFFYFALEKQELSLISSLDESWIIVAILIAVFAFGETIGLTHALAIVAILAGAFFVSVDFSKFKNWRFIAGSGYEFLAIIFVGISVPLERILIGRIGESNVILYMYLIYFPLIFLVKFLRRENFIKPDKRLFKLGALSGLTDGAAFAFYLLAIKSADISLVSPIVASSVLVTVILARIYLKEKMTPKEIFGATLILAGVIVLSKIVAS